MTISFECLYCGNSWKETYYAMPNPEYVKCSKCKDKNVKIRKHTTLDYYSKKSLDKEEKDDYDT